MVFKILRFFWNCLNFLRRVLMNLAFLFVAGILLFSSTLFVEEQRKQPVPQGALRLNLDGFLADNRDQNSGLKALLNNVQKQVISEKISVFDVVFAITQAKKDERIKGIVLDLNHFKGGDFPSLTFIGEALNEFKQSGKPVIAVSDNYSQKQYILASYADKIYLHRQGQVELTGLGGEQFYYKSLLDKIDAQPHIFRVGTYKSAVEPLLRDDMSEAARQNASQWLNAMWNNIKTTVSNNRHLKQEQIFPSTNDFLQQVKNLKGDLTQYALTNKLVTEVATRYQISAALKQQFGADRENNTYQYIDFSNYLYSLPDYETANATSNNIAVLRVEGAIIDGESDDENVGGDTIARLLRQAAENTAVKAVVLRINSPGGSAFASEVIREEVEHLQQIGKPVVVSMGGMAASGGYWIASTADYIIADKNTITGSIGIFAAFVTLEKSLANLGIHSDGVKTSPLASMSPFTALSQEYSDVIQMSIEHGYDQFISLVAKGRKLDKSQVDKIAQGRVWLGEDALKYKLVDELGDFNTAIAVASEKIREKEKGLTDDQIGFLWLSEDQSKGLLSLLGQKKSSMLQDLLRSIGIVDFTQIKQMHQQLGLLTQFTDPKGQYLYCLNCQSTY
ncbi:protease [Gallibacterium anatis str. Avicor]|uniref:signal peptide peptidase SppA n=1 Tax=Gallibacterium anatis TaxID=750 RepID=UPI0005317C86|nr:signal peptide peptidase SppA [Gallibacterium anatis]KGQ56280.1 protease [Gallibacterium anatis str. Avicor]KGQ64935.1 protease [Gallibacterium anatis 7990]WAX72351.1 signal peptide peptidase SppA [Gallibacterium anatis]